MVVPFFTNKLKKVVPHQQITLVAS